MGLVVEGIVDIELTSKRTGDTKHYSFKNSISDYGLEYILRTPNFAIEEMVISDSEDPIDNAQMDPSVGSFHLIADVERNTQSGFVNVTGDVTASNVPPGSSYIEYNCTSVFNYMVDDYDPMFEYPPKKISEVSLLVAHPSRKWDGHYRAVFARAKVKNLSELPISLDVYPGDMILINYRVIFTFNHISGDNQVALLGISLGNSANVEIGGQQQPYRTDSKRDKHSPITVDVIYPSRHRMVINMTRNSNPARGRIEYNLESEEANTMLLGIFRIRFKWTFLQAVANTKRHMIIDVSRRVYDQTVLDNLPNNLTVYSSENQYLNFASPGDVMFFFYNKEHQFLEQYERTATGTRFTIPTTYNTKYNALTTTYTDVKDGELLDVYAEVGSQGIYKLPNQVRARDTIPPNIEFHSWTDRRNLKIYTESAGSIRFGLTNVIESDFDGLEDLLNTPENEYNWNNYGTNVYFWNIVNFPGKTILPEDIIEPHPTDPKKFLINVHFPIEIKDYHRIYLYVTDHENNLTSRTDVYTERVDHQPLEFTYDPLQVLSYFKPSWDNPYAHIPKDSLTMTTTLLAVEIEDID